MKRNVIIGMLVILYLFCSLIVSATSNPIPDPRGESLTPPAEIAVMLAEFSAFFVGIIVLELFGMEGKKKVALVSATVVLASLVAGIAIWMLTGLLPYSSTLAPEIWAISFLLGEFGGFLVGWIILMLFGMERKTAILTSTIILLTSLSTSIFFYWWAGVFP